MRSSGKKGLRIPKVLKQVAKAPMKLPVRVATPKHGMNPVTRARRSPAPGETPLVMLRVQVISCRDLLAKDRNGASDPFVVLSLVGNRFQTPVIKRSLNPNYDEKDATFDFPIYLSLAEVTSVLEIIVWDKDILSKEYLGEIALPVEDWFKDGIVAFSDPKKAPISLNLVSTRSKLRASGSVQVKLGLVKPNGTVDADSLEQSFAEIIQRSQAAIPTVMSAPPTRGIGTVRSRKDIPDDEDEVSELEDDGLSSDEEDDSGDESDNEGGSPFLPPVAPSATISGAEVTQLPTIIGSPPVPVIRKSTSPGFLPRVFSPRLSKGSPKESTSSIPDHSTASGGTSSSPPVDYLTARPTVPSPSRTETGTSTPSGRSKRPKFKKRTKDTAYNFSAQRDILGIVMLEIAGAEDLPKLKNMTRTGWDMDPFVVVSFGKKVFRTRVMRHSLNPQWEEKLLFHVRRYEAAFEVNFAVLDWDKFSGNDLIGDVSLPLAELLANAPKPDPKTGLYTEGVEKPQSMKEFTLPLGHTAKEAPWEAKHSPRLTFRAQYQPYDALRQRFWRQYLKQYDTDETGTFSRIELRSMLDSLGSTLTHETLDSFFTRHGKNAETDELSMDEAIQCLEAEISRPPNEKNRIEGDEAPTAATGSATPNLNFSDFPAVDSPNGNIDFSGPDAATEQEGNKPALDMPEFQRESNQRVIPGQSKQSVSPAAALDAGNYVASGQSQTTTGPSSRTNSAVSSDTEGISSSDPSSSSSADVERVINIKTCPLCHRPRMNSKAEVDIVTHLGVCASSDWNRVDRIVVGNYVTASQAQRKWYTKVITKVSSGAYQLGANSANIIVQNRMTGQLEEEKMQVYVRLGIRLLYKGASGRMEGGKARRLLKSLSIKQGLKYDSPDSAREIPSFIAFHNLKVDEIRDPLNSFKTFNQFFYRKLKEDARPVASPNDPSVLVSGADCRMMAFESVDEATKLWIKGREFTVGRLLGPQYASDAPKYSGGTLAIFRLAPQDYHRFHSPVDGKIGAMTYISGEYYTVNPQAVRSQLDIYGENARKIVPIDSPHFGRVYAVCIGAMMVGSIVTTVDEGQEIHRGDEFGYFAFGGSTIVLLFEKGVVQWDEDLVINGRACLETLVRVGMQVGRSVRPPNAISTPSA